MKGLSLNQQKHYFRLSPLTTNILFPWHWCHLGNKSMGRKWRDNKEIMWKKQHLILISWWRGGGGGVEGWRAKLEELKWPTEWETNSYQGEKCCGRATRGCTLRGVGVNQNVRWGRGSAVAEGNKEVYEAEEDGFVLHKTRHVPPRLSAAARASCKQHRLTFL